MPTITNGRPPQIVGFKDITVPVGNKVVLSNCLATTRPDIAVQWHPTKNGNLTPYMVTAGCHKKIWWKCPVADNHEWKSMVLCRTNGNGCPFCNESSGEKEVAKVLKQAGIVFKRECSFKSCKSKKPLRFDFAVKTPNGIKLIEYQGQQHYEPISFGSKSRKADVMFVGVQKRDRIKRDWCKARKIPLLEIPYTDFTNIKQLVSEFMGLKCLNLF